MGNEKESIIVKWKVKKRMKGKEKVAMDWRSGEENYEHQEEFAKSQ
jgi:hypothetical protein